jgi:4-amino-4-deoxy-L-arabinose transferase-like glycosyltransferase
VGVNLESESRIVKLTVLFILALTMFRAFLLFVNGLPLYADEAQYWIWSKNLDFGYYSKPPIIAWMIAASTWLFGNGEAGIRFLSPITHMFTSFAILALGKRLFDSKIGALSAIIFATLPSIFLSSTLISTDVPLMLVWVLTLYTLYIALENNSLAYWCWSGVLAGLGFMTKYHFGVILPATLIYCLWSGKLSYTLKSPGPYIASVIALIIFSPNIYWNWHNGFVSFIHTADLAGAKSTFSSTSSAKSLIKFLFDQLAVFGPFLLPFTVFGLVKVKPSTDSVKFLSSYMLTFIGVIAIFAIKNKAHANWTAPAYVSGSILAAYFFVRLDKIKWFKYNTIAHCVIGFIIMFAPLFMSKFPAKLNPFSRVMGYEKLGEEVSYLAVTYETATLATDDRKVYALIVYYSHPHLFSLKKFNYNNQVDNHFDLTAPLEKSESKIILISKYASQQGLTQHFKGAMVEELKFKNSLGYRAFYIVQ